MVEMASSDANVMQFNPASPTNNGCVRDEKKGAFYPKCIDGVEVDELGFEQLASKRNQCLQGGLEELKVPIVSGPTTIQDVRKSTHFCQPDRGGIPDANQSIYLPNIDGTGSAHIRSQTT